MTRKQLFAVLALLATAGFVDALYLTDMAFAGARLTCNIAGLDGCNIVAQSKYSLLLGLPLALYGVVFYGLTLGTLVLIQLKIQVRLEKVLVGIACVGALFSSYFLYLQFFQIRALVMRDLPLRHADF